MLLGQGEGDNVIAESCAEPAVASSRNHDVLLSVLAPVGHRRCLPACRQRAFPQLLAGFYVEGSQVLIHRRGDEDKSARRDD